MLDNHRLKTKNTHGQITLFLIADHVDSTTALSN